MVGVAGKSKGCNTCRKRKIACDQQRPVCTQCTRSNRVCGGYQRDRVFVLVQPAAKKTHVFLKPTCIDQGFFAESTQNAPEIRERLSPCVSPAASTNTPANRATYPFPERSIASAIIQRRNETHNLVLAFLSHCLPAHQLSWTSRSWVSLLAELPSEVKALELSSAALAMSTLGRTFQDPTLVKESLNLYTQGLQHLQRALWNHNLMREDGTLAACMALSLYEVMECPEAGSYAYFSHCQGLIALVQARGVRAHSSGAGHQLFVGVRLPAILCALERSETSFLFNSDWMDQPWAATRKTFFDRVIDCFAQAPGILKRVHLIPHLSPNEQINLANELIHECWQIDEKLDLIDDEMQRATREPLYWPVPSQINTFDGGRSGKLFPVVFHFTDLGTAATLMLLWAVRVMLWSGLWNSQKLVSIMVISNSSTPETLETGPVSRLIPRVVEPFRPLGHREDYLLMAHRVCQSVEYFLHDDLQLAGPLSVSPALGIVLSTLGAEPRHAREVAWIRAALHVVQQKGLRVLKYIQ
ncbi:hypothetical protein BDV28DRAFT_149242 [Aspergillus coremiiformis]|uniref:Zn(2)-C6 fungal-type domain-containing protein n=1 Tax=Aspergillus coremiiformis TaxID=138285 RepID=A0A5N6Z3E8_9EURO|nr:hypothetical protein BDV28DRAFT_149242 [Aspergillus coremiiformis]